MFVVIDKWLNKLCFLHKLCITSLLNLYKIIGTNRSIGAFFVVHRLLMGTPLGYHCSLVVAIFVSVILIVAFGRSLAVESPCSPYTRDDAGQKDRRSSEAMYANNLFCLCFLFCYVNCTIVRRLELAANEVSSPFLHQLDGLEVIILVLRSQLQNA